MNHDQKAGTVVMFRHYFHYIETNEVTVISSSFATWEQAATGGGALPRINLTLLGVLAGAVRYLGKEQYKVSFDGETAFEWT